MAALKFEKVEVFEGVHYWRIIDESGRMVGEMQKERDRQWRGSGWYVSDGGAPWVWSVSVEDSAGHDVIIEVPDGSTAWEARRIVKAAVC